MSNSVKPQDLGMAIAKELGEYREDVTRRVNSASLEAAVKLVEITKATAPKKTGNFRKRIAYTQVGKNAMGSETYAWHVKAPDYRLTHLLVHGHDKVGGGRVEGDPFLHNAVDKVLPEFEQSVEEAVTHD